MKKKIIIKVFVEIFKKYAYQDKDKFEKKLWIMEFITAHLLCEKKWKWKIITYDIYAEYIE